MHSGSDAGLDLARPMLAQAGPEAFTQLIPLVLILGVFYFLLIRPQQQKAKEHDDMLAALEVGDRIVTSGGIYGKVVELRQNDLSLEICGSPRIIVQQDRSKIATVEKKGRRKED